MSLVYAFKRAITEGKRLKLQGWTSVLFGDGTKTERWLKIAKFCHCGFLTSVVVVALSRLALLVEDFANINLCPLFPVFLGLLF